MSQVNSKTVSSAFEAASAEDRKKLNDRLESLCGAVSDEAAVMKEAISYSLLGRAKRMRPLLCLWSHDLAGGKDREACIDVACALEALHTYSLIHDDLPCMDDDDMRRGIPSAHKKFGEAVAVLAGDALLTMCFDIVSSLTERWRLPAERGVEIASIIASAAGAGGMIAGQVLDLEGENHESSLEEVDKIHQLKTAVLISASMHCGAAVAGAGESMQKAVKRAGLLAGSAFQIVDDILDEITETGVLGKTTGKDAKQNKQTYPAAVGVKKARERASSLINEAASLISPLGDATLILSLFDFILKRDH